MMGIQDGTLRFELTRPLKYKFDGSTHDATHVILQEPGAEHRKFYRKLKQLFSRAQTDLITKLPEIKKARDDIGEENKPLHLQPEKTEEGLGAEVESLRMMLQSSQSVEYSIFCETFEKMACVLNPRKSICLIDGKLAMNDVLLQSLHPDDGEEMALRWFAFFAMPSEGGEKTSSEQPSTSAPQRTEA